MSPAEIKSLKKGDYIKQCTTYFDVIVFRVVSKNKTRVRIEWCSPSGKKIDSIQLSGLKYNLWQMDYEYAIKKEIKDWIEE